MQPSERLQTVRQQLIELLEHDVVGVREMSQAVSLSEKEIYHHLSHIAKSLQSCGKRLHAEAACCLDCGFVFEQRSRKKPPGRCPACRKTHIQRPQFTIS